MTHQEFQPQSDAAEPPPGADALARGFQVERISNKTVVAWVSAILGLGVLAVVVCFGLWAWLASRTSPPDPIANDQLTPLDPHQRQTRLRFEDEQRETLKSYRWVEPERDIVSVPIERAMELLIERTKP